MPFDDIDGSWNPSFESSGFGGSSVWNAPTSQPVRPMSTETGFFGSIGNKLSGLNWKYASDVLGGIGTSIKGGMEIGSALAAPAFADIQASAFRWAGQQQAAELRRQGQAAVKNIGIVQQQGLDAATLRYNALGEEIARQRVAAAGSGIDLSSRTVGKAEQTSRKNAAWDVTRISRNTKIAADNWNEQAEAAFRNSAYAQIQGEYQAKVAEIQGDLQKKMGLFSGITQSVLGIAQAGVGGYMMGSGGSGGGFS